MKRKYKDDRVFRILMLISLVCVIIIIIFGCVYFLGGTTKSKYGDRLDGISSYIIKDSVISEIKDEITKEKNVEEVKINLQGKIFYVIIYLNDGGKAIDGVNASTKALEKFSDEEKKFYEFQFIVTKKNLSSDEVFPIMGYKNNISAGITWTNYEA